MIKFFRKIRQQLLTENKFSKYLIYAFGEIILVVIGILIAFQINSWNAENLLIEKEIKHLSGIESDLKENVKIFRKSIDSQSENMEKIDFLLKVLEEKRPYTLDFSTNLRSVKGIEEIEIITTGFNTLSAFGMDNIRSDSLRSEIVLLFDHKFPNNQSLFHDLGRMHHESLVIPIMLKHFTNGEGSRPIPNNYQQLLESKEFISMLGTRRNVKLALVGRLEGMIRDSDALTLHIQEELEKITKA
tara:strand:+ start:355 stop:1086 length:732 start_codon:yes stop_codon:yes gene_type:complete